MNDNELYHYGVLGMKWGVKHDRNKAISKSYNKLNKLDIVARNKSLNYNSDNSKYLNKYSKLQNKAVKLSNKYNRKVSGWRGVAEKTKTEKLRVKAEAAQAKANAYKQKNENKILQKQASAAVATVKAQKWAKSMFKNIGRTSVDEVPSEYVELGKRYCLVA